MTHHKGFFFILFCLLLLNLGICDGRIKKNKPSKTKGRKSKNKKMKLNAKNCEWDTRGVRNEIGRALLQTPQKVKEAKELINLGKTYKLNLNYDDTTGSKSFPGRTSDTFLSKHLTNGEPQLGFTQLGLYTNAIGNIGSQFDGLGHIFQYDKKNPNDETKHLFYNNFRGSEIYTTKRLSKLGVQKLPMFFTRGILLDVVGYKNMEILPIGYEITTADVENTLRHQGMNMSDITPGDVLLFYTGYIRNFGSLGFYDGGPGIGLDVLENILVPKNVMIVGADTWGIDQIPNAQNTVSPVHVKWQICHGGFFNELANLGPWVMDARAGISPYMGAYIFNPMSMTGGPGSPATAAIVV